MISNEAFFETAKVDLFTCSDATLAVRIYGTGPALIFIHGWPVHGYTWRHLLPKLATRFTCYVLDLPGLGNSQWTSQTDFNFNAKARQIVEFTKAKNINNYSIIAQDTGATVARLIALTKGQKVEKLILFNTEIPNHRPPWIPLYQVISRIPFAQLPFRVSLKSRWFIRAPMGFKGFYANKKLLDIPTNLNPYIQPLIQSGYRMKGAMNYLIGCDLRIVDLLLTKHKEITAAVTFIWGVEDPTFPVELGAQMITQFQNAQFIRLENAALMPQEEQPERILEILEEEVF